jgi:hypothetical protein
VIEEKGLKARAAKYFMEAGQLFINMQRTSRSVSEPTEEAEVA